MRTVSQRWYVWWSLALSTLYPPKTPLPASITWCSIILNKYLLNKKANERIGVEWISNTVTYLNLRAWNGEWQQADVETLMETLAACSHCPCSLDQGLMPWSWAAMSNWKTMWATQAILNSLIAIWKHFNASILYIKNVYIIRAKRLFQHIHTEIIHEIFTSFFVLPLKSCVYFTSTVNPNLD